MFMSSPVSAMMFLRLGPLVCESLKSEVCRNDSAQLSQPRFYVHFANHLFMLISASVEITCVCADRPSFKGWAILKHLQQGTVKTKVEKRPVNQCD